MPLLFVPFFIEVNPDLIEKSFLEDDYPRQRSIKKSNGGKAAAVSDAPKDDQSIIHPLFDDGIGENCPSPFGAVFLKKQWQQKKKQDKKNSTEAAVAKKGKG
jgi:hypothetical protein